MISLSILMGNREGNLTTNAASSFIHPLQKILIGEYP